MEQGYLRRFLKEHRQDSWRLVSIMAVCSGLANGALLGLINGGASSASQSGVKLQYFILFIVAMGIFCYAKKVSMSHSIRTIEKMLHQLRMRIIEKMRWSELRGMESFTKGEVYTKISQDTVTISQSAFFLVNIVQSGIMVICCLLYIAWISPWAFLVTLVAVTLAISIYWGHRKRLVGDMADMSRKEMELVDSVSHIIEGYKEIRVNKAKNDGVFAHYANLAEESKRLKIKSNDTFIIEIMFSQIFFYLLIAAVVFILPQLVPTYSAVVIKTTAAILFVVGPLDMIATTAPLVTRANSALKNIYDLEDRIDALTKGKQDVYEAPSIYAGFSSVAAQGIQFTYRDENNNPLFAVGPFNLEIKRGEVVFFVGGNGCGKTTLMKMLTGLYRPDLGELRVDGTRVEPQCYQNYRELFSVIFSDFHLFDRLYGLDDVAPAKVRELLKEMDIAHKTRFEDGRFTQVDLSTGQRKRMALISALLEDRPILMFDEWAADQDPHFRKYFYETMVPAFKKAGKTVLAVSHDDRYWHIADRVVKMEYGQVAGIEDHQNRAEGAL